MSLLVIVVIASVVVALVGALFVVGIKGSKLGEEFETLQGQHRALLDNVETLHAAERELSVQLERRPEIKRKTYRIQTLGMKATGKTSLALKWANPLTDLSSISSTKNERYERSVSHVQTAKEDSEHVFEVSDWGGEHTVDAVQELSTEDVHGLLLVVDLGGKGATQVELERVKAQLQEFQPQALRYFFVPKVAASCKTVVLFINKSDLILGTPEQVEEQAKYLYQPLIDGLIKAASPIDVKVVVGSAQFGHSTHCVFSHFIAKILPRDAYDRQLLQHVKKPERETSSSMSFSAPPLPPSELRTDSPSFVRKPPPRQNTLSGPGDTAAFLQKMKNKNVA